jgi:hypothetical protein
MSMPANTWTDFWNLVRKSKRCWLWTGVVDRDGYGIYRMRGHQSRAHRFSWVFANGAIPPGLWVLHKCDNPSCVRPDHLFLGTHRDNMDDMIAKGRTRMGEGMTHAKLTGRDVRDIRSRYAAGETQESIARAFNIDRSNVSIITLRKGWRHIQ